LITCTVPSEGRRFGSLFGVSTEGMIEAINAHFLTNVVLAADAACRDHGCE
jgi:hypothetical protein